MVTATFYAIMVAAYLPSVPVSPCGSHGSICPCLVHRSIVCGILPVYVSSEHVYVHTLCV